MAHAKETPRQKMIGMMYLVLMALLALNVSKDVLDAFVLVDESLTKTTENFYEKNDVYYEQFDRAAAESPIKAAPWKAKADEVRRRSDELVKFIQDLKLEIVIRSEGKETEAIESNEIHGDLIGGKDKTDVPAIIMIGDNNNGKANDLKTAIEEYREHLLSLIDEKSETTRESIENSLDTSDPPPVEGETPTWQTEHFEHLPLIAVITLLSKMQSDVRNAESDAIRYLYAQIEAGSFKFDKLDPVVLTKSNYVTRGQAYEASVFMAAFDTKQRPVVYVGDFDSTVSDDGMVQYNMKGELGRDYDTLRIEQGKGVYTVNTTGTSTGYKKWGGIISLKMLDGSYTNKPFTSEYQVAEPNFVVSPTKMLVFYLGVANPVEISVAGTPSDRIIPSTNNGKISPSGKGYVVYPTKEGTSDISVSVRTDGGGTRSMGSRLFRVKRVPDPNPTIAGKKGGTFSKSEITAELGPKAEMPPDFDFDLEFKVTSFTMATYMQGFLKRLEAKTGNFTPEMRDVIRGLGSNSSIYIEDVVAVGPDGVSRNIGTIQIKLR